MHALLLIFVGADVALIFLIAIHWFHKVPCGFVVKQLRGKRRWSMAITGIHVGGSGSFTAKPNGALQAGDVPKWTSPDTLVTIAPAADGLSATVSVGAADTNASFDLTVSGVNSLGSPVTTSVTVPVLPAPPAPATAFDIEQTA